MFKSKKFYSILFLVIFISGYFSVTYAIWNENLATDEIIDTNSGSWNESEKYIILMPVYEGETISSYAVSGYEGLIETVEIPRVYENKPVTAIKGSFANNNLIKEIIIPDTVIIIEAYAFLNFTRLNKVTVRGEEKTLTIGEYCFVNCSALSVFEINAVRILSITESSFFNTDGISKPSA